MHDLAREQIAHGRKPDVGMCPYIELAVEAESQIDRSHVVEEDEGANHTALRERQDAADFEAAAQVAATLLDDHFNHGGSPAR